MAKRYRIPMLALRGLTIFPGMILHFDIGRQKSIQAVEAAMAGDRLILLCFQKDVMMEEPEAEDIARMGTVAEIKQMLRLPDGNLRVLVSGLFRAKVTRFYAENPYFSVGAVRKEDIPIEDSLQAELLIRRIHQLLERFLGLYERITPETAASIMAIEDPGELADITVANFPLKPQNKQMILEELSVEERLNKLTQMMADELDILEIERSVMAQTKENIDKHQREYILREQMKVIQEELGEYDYAQQDIEKYERQLDERKLPTEVADKLNEELDRLARLHPQSQEYAVVQNYVETVLALPWEFTDEENLDLLRAKHILARDHYGLEKVKERILEYLAVKHLLEKPKGSILCLVGPPGTGKTSVARSLAEAMNRKYVRISLGGLQNEAELRGHRKTYVGAMPGRIIAALKQAGSSNPLILLDEIDKMSSDFHGDPSAAMLEVLDPEQNASFRDHFLELPFDLSNVMFIVTANTLSTIPRPLLDRMDVVDISGYTEDEKVHIAKRHLLPKQERLHGLQRKNLRLSETVLRRVINGYTREAGVRNLERRLADICRKAARILVEGEKQSVSVTLHNLSDFLGRIKFMPNSMFDSDQIGIATGLAWTEVGGDTLSIEVNIMDGTGKLELTGSLGDVMKESAKAAISYTRANCTLLGISADFYKTKDIHIHVPEGAVPKDGPSAGITMATALISALTGRAVRRDIAMTGEITLRGRVLPIGGLREKSLAAYQLGIRHIIIPYENKKDYEELPEKVRHEIKFTFAKDMHTVLKNALCEMHKETVIVQNDPHYIQNVKDCALNITSVPVE